MRKHRKIWIFGICLITLFLLAGCGSSSRSGEESTTSLSGTPQSEVVQEQVADGSEFASKAQSLGRSYLTPVVMGFAWGNPPKPFQDDKVVLSLVCGQEVAFINPQVFFRGDLLQESTQAYMAENDLSEIPQDQQGINAVAIMGKDSALLNIESPLRILTEHAYLVASVPREFNLSLAQGECNFPRGDYRDFNLYDEVYISAGTEISMNEGGIGHMSNDPKGDRFDVPGGFTITTSSEIIPGALVLGKDNGSPVVLGIVLERQMVGEIVFVLGINTVFPKTIVE